MRYAIVFHALLCSSCMKAPPEPLVPAQAGLPPPEKDRESAGSGAPTGATSPILPERSADPLVEITVYSPDEALQTNEPISKGGFDTESSIEKVVVPQVSACTSAVAEVARDWARGLGPDVKITEDKSSATRFHLHFSLSEDGHYEVRYEVLKAARKARASLTFVDRNGNTLSPSTKTPGIRELTRALTTAVQCAGG